MIPLPEGATADTDGVSPRPSTPKTVLEIPSDDEADEVRILSEAPTAATKTLPPVTENVSDSFGVYDALRNLGSGAKSLPGISTSP